MFAAYALSLSWLPIKFTLLILAASVIFVGWSTLKIIELVKSILKLW